MHLTDIRFATEADDATLARIDALTWTEALSVGPEPTGGFFGGRVRPCDVLVAERGGTVVGYVQLGNALPVASHTHVAEIHGLAVDPVHARRGLGRQLLAAAVAEARARGAHKLTLRVLAPNTGARRLYEAAGFAVEGVLRAEFHLAGRDVDDVLMALYLN